MRKDDVEESDTEFEKGGYWKLPWSFSYKGNTYYREYLFYETEEYRQRRIIAENKRRNYEVRYQR